MAIKQLGLSVLSGVFAFALFGCSSAEPSADGEETVEALPAELTSQLNGFLFTAPCVRLTEKDVCLSVLNLPCPGANTDDPALSGALLTDQTIRVGGSSTIIYNIKLRVRGVVEAKKYTNSVDSNSSALSPAANGFAVGGKPVVTDAYNVFMIRTNSPRQDYFLNSLIPPGVSNHTTYGVDYTATIRARGGSTIRLVASDSNCSMIKNCGPNGVPGTCAAPITLDPTPPAVTANPQLSSGQWLQLTIVP